jgi:hypothetical protein
MFAAGGSYRWLQWNVLADADEGLRPAITRETAECPGWDSNPQCPCEQRLLRAPAVPVRLPGQLSGIHHPMAKLLFIPVSIGGGLVAGFVSKKVFDQLWGLIDEEEPPDSKHRDIDWRKLLLAAAVQGAIFRAVREASDHYSRRAFARTTGTWPGEESPEDE